MLNYIAITEPFKLQLWVTIVEKSS